jgi:lysophospholipase L1-like esterase
MTRSLVLLLVALSVSGVATVPCSAATEFALKDGDRVVFFGDSITEQRLYTRFVEEYVVSRFADRKITFINSGWGGDQVSRNECEPCGGVGALARIDRDVIAKKPTVVTLLFGMNDGRYQDFDAPTLATYEEGLTRIIRTIKERTSARIYVMTPTVYDGTRHTPWSKTDRYNEVLDRYGESAKRIAAAEHLPVIDLHRVTTEALARAQAADPTFTFAEDGVHPDENGQVVMAAEILRAWGAPAEGVTLSAPAKDGVAEVAGPLPWSAKRPSEKLLAAGGAVRALGSVRVRVTGLAPGRYRVKVDDADAGTLDAAALWAGVAVSSISATALEAADELSDVVREREDVYFARWRMVAVPVGASFREAPRAVNALDALVAEMFDRERRLGAPHRYRIRVEPAQ